MYQYKAVLKSSKKVIAEGHSVEDVEHKVKHFKREQKKGLHTKGNDVIEIIHNKINHISGNKKEELIKVI
ncbi:MAG: hypothetical protein KAG14_01905 [Mycoplasmataceae bacterium]|nr:hypothetical protein [Mycoplasmataceae bacterium]